MNVEGDEAAKFDAVRLDSLVLVNTGPLLKADDVTGYVQWKDRSGETVEVTLGDHRIRIVTCSRYTRS